MDRETLLHSSVRCQVESKLEFNLSTPHSPQVIPYSELLPLELDIVHGKLSFSHIL